MLRTDNYGVARAFAQQSHATNSNNQFFTGEEGEALVLYSYGLHWPVMAWIDGKLHVNDDRYSTTTSKHRSFAISGIVRELGWRIADSQPEGRIIHHATCADMCRAVRGHAL